MPVNWAGGRGEGAEVTYPQITICEIQEEKTEDVSSNKNPLNLHELELV